MPQISVIIPVYNTEKYLREAVDSILNQTFRDIEVIAINDGSTDNCLDILNEYAQKDNRVKVFSQKNSGQATARNFGIDNSNGKYIYFFDSDDILVSTALEETYNKCEKDNLDFCFFDAEVFYDDIKYNLYYDYYRCHLLEDKIYNGVDITNLLLDLNKFRASPCLYLTKRDYWKQLNIYFDSIIHEDELFSSLLYLQAERVSFVNKTFFRRRVRSSSTVTSAYSEKNLYAYFFTVDKLLDFSNKNIEYKTTINRLCSNIVNSAVYRANSLQFKYKIYCIKKVCLQYNNLIKLKPILVCLFPFIIRKTK
jgi:glycosyltransferase involved in cell wall biosynthesis